MPGRCKKTEYVTGTFQNVEDANQEETPLIGSTSHAKSHLHRWWKLLPTFRSILSFCILTLVVVFYLTYVVKPRLWKAVWCSIVNNLIPPTHPDCPIPAYARWCRTWSGLDMSCMHDDIVCDSICNWGYWEFESIASMGFPHVPAGGVVDVGANVGWYSFLFASAGHTVYAFEALASNVALMKGSLCANPSLPGRIEIHEVALGEKAGGKCEIYSSERNLGDGALCCNMDNCPMFWNSFYHHRQSVVLSTLDNELLKSGILDKPLAFMKVDVEGLECEVLQGAHQTLESLGPQYLMSEIWNREEGCSVGGFLSMLRSNGYKVVIGRSLGFPAAFTDTADTTSVADDGPHNAFAERFPWPALKQSLLENMGHSTHPNILMRRPGKID